MKTSSCKAKGRRLQQQVRDSLLESGKQFGLVEGDVVSTAMGQSGVDVVFSPAAKKVFPLAIECKNVEKLNVPTVFKKHAEKYPNDTPLLIHTRNHQETLVTLRWADLLPLLEVKAKQ